jgi:protein-disulfide isomerase
MIETTETPIEEPKPDKPAPFNWVAVLVPLALLLGLGAGYLIWGLNSGQAAATAPGAEQAQIQIPEEVTRYNIPVDDDPIYGPVDAPITIVEFSDYECPYCMRWQEEVWKQLKEEYPTQVRLVYRDFPLPSHPNALPAAMAANCANEQDKYWEYHDLLFSGANGLNTDAYLQYAQELKLDLDAFQTCLDENRYEAEVLADLDWASQLGVSSTPTFFLNGIPLVGAQPYEVFKQVIDLELEGKIPGEIPSEPSVPVP